MERSEKDLTRDWTLGDMTVMGAGCTTTGEIPFTGVTSQAGGELERLALALEGRHL